MVDNRADGRRGGNVPARVPCRYGLIGSGIGASLSPALHEGEGPHHGLDLTYELIDVQDPDTPDDLDRLLREAEEAGFAGLNVTHPFKQRVIPRLDGLSRQAEDIGAVNTIVFSGGRRVGHNTDAAGFAESFARELPGAATGHVVQLGAGGAGAACAHAQLTAGTGRLTIADPDPARRAALVGRLTARFGAGRIAGIPPSGLETALASADGVVNASPVGMRSHPGTPMPVDLLRPGLWLVDIVYMPLTTRLLQAARSRGVRAIGGAGMCVFQAAASFELITGRVPDTGRMLRHLRALLAERRSRPCPAPATPRRTP
ncbi:shikimate dehydrogenase [Actinomadura sp. NBRC 104412]|uniref:shikimate dehydrogenase n=1 Tax=Actinomadura sp. NBRC 104412 TaxID=3032203 RepID=UPI002554FD13|nr:shikimate dehydrogenase [Actinomadura sp. NBRC 104412]